jgi:hypothetical protein
MFEAVSSKTGTREIREPQIPIDARADFSPNSVIYSPCYGRRPIITRVPAVTNDDFCCVGLGMAHHREMRNTLKTLLFSVALLTAGTVSAQTQLDRLIAAMSGQPVPAAQYAPSANAALEAYAESTKSNAAVAREAFILGDTSPHTADGHTVTPSNTDVVNNIMGTLSRRLAVEHALGQ